MSTLIDELRNENREGEYRLPERDKTSTGKLTLPNDTQVSFKRYVNRVGYALDVKSYTKEQWNAAGLEIVCKSTDLDEVTNQKVLKSLNLLSPYKGIRSAIYSKLVGSKSKDTLRSMWFKDFKHSMLHPRDSWRGRIIGRCRRWTGQYYAGHTYGGGLEYSYDYDPPCLAGVNQNLYLVKNLDNGFTYMVHPLDVEVVCSIA